MDGLVKSLGAIEVADDLAAIESVVRDVARPLGYDRFILFSASPLRDELIERIYWTEGDWFGDGSAVDATSYIQRCPVTRHILDASEPFFWTKTQSAGGERYRVVRSPRGPGVHGLQVPVFGHAGLEGAISYGGDRIDVSLATRARLTMIGTAAFRAARSLLEAGQGGRAAPLSVREREVLRWIAAGRRQAEVAAMLDLSERTIENHLRNIRRRLGAQTTPEAVRIAVRKGDLAD